MPENDFVEEVSQILADMREIVDRTSEHLAEDIQPIRLSPPTLTFRKSAIFPYYTDHIVDILQGTKQLGTLRLERTGHSTYQVLVFVGNQARQSRHISVGNYLKANDIQRAEAAIMAEFSQIMQEFFPGFKLQL